MSDGNVFFALDLRGGDVGGTSPLAKKERDKFLKRLNAIADQSAV